MATVLKSRVAVGELKQQLCELANAQFDSPQFRRLLGLRMNRARAAVYMVQRTLWTLNRREAWAGAQASAPLDVKKLIWEHEREELEGEPERGMPDHFTLGVNEGESVGLTRQDFEKTPPCDGLLACSYAWRYIALHSPWLKAMTAAACLETSNSDEIVRGGGMAHRMAHKFRDEAGITFQQQVSNVEHMAADVRHANLLFEVIDRHVATEGDRALVLEGARESWALDRVWKGQLAEVIAAVPE